MNHHNEAVKRYKEKHKALGLCIDCSNEAMPGRLRCVCCGDRENKNGKRLRRLYPEKMRAKDQRIRQKRLALGLCPNCGGLRDEPSKKTCINCRLEIHTPTGSFYATHQASRPREF
jgi:hypothetical protein